MAMMIAKFHKLIQSKLLWLIFLGIVVISFVFMDAVVPSTPSAEQTAPGVLDGEPVPEAQFREAYFGTYLTVVMAVGRAIDITPRIDEQLREAAWQRIVALRAAERMGINATDDEVAAAIQQHEGFSFEGQFNIQAYKAFVQNFLARMGFTERLFEEHVRAEIVLQKLRSVIDRTTLVSPLELQRAFRTVTDRFTAEYTLVTPDLVEKDVALTDEQVKAFFDRDPAAFTRPAQVSVNVVTFDAARHAEQAVVTDEEAQAYYDENLREFVDETAETNDTAASTNVFETLTRYRPFDDVKAEIVSRLARVKAVDAARDAAMEFVVSLAPDADGRAPALDAAASNLGLTVTALAPFAATDEVPGYDDAPLFKRTAFELTPGPETYFSDPVAGSNAVHVLALREQIAARVPAFEEVKDEVLERARAEAITEALSKKTEAIRNDVITGLTQNISFADTLAFHGLKVSTTETFSASTGLPENEELGSVIVGAVMTLNQGEVSDATPVEGGLLLVHVKTRASGEAVTLDAIRPQLLETIRRQSGRLYFDAWQKHLLQKANFQDNRPAADEGEEEFDEDEAGSDQSG